MSRWQKPHPASPQLGLLAPRTTHLPPSTPVLSNYESQIELVFEVLCKDPNRTSGELADHHGLDRYMVARRLSDLAKRGRVMRCTPRICESKGTTCIVWRPI